MLDSHGGAPPAPAPNTPLGHFILVDRIAVGGMAEVFRALEPRTAGEPRVVVLKRMASRYGQRHRRAAPLPTGGRARPADRSPQCGSRSQRGRNFRAIII